MAKQPRKTTKKDEPEIETLYESTNPMVCGAKLRKKDAFCNSTKLMSNGRCRIHGGKTPAGLASPNFKTGATSKYAYLPKQLLSRAESLFTDTLKNIEENIQILKSIETQYLEKLSTKESTEAWSKLHVAVRQYESAEFETKNEADEKLLKAKAFGMIKFIVNEGLSESFLHSDIMRIQEQQRKLTETLSKCRKEQQEIFTMEDVNQILGTILHIVKANVDGRTLSTIQNEITVAQAKQIESRT